MRKSLLAKDEELSTLADAVLSLRDELASVKGQSHVEAHRAIAKKAHDLQVSYVGIIPLSGALNLKWLCLLLLRWSSDRLCFYDA